ncbi:MAG: hypothetical protein ACRDZ3_02495 [Acidimicrobiia bacterium]
MKRLTWLLGLVALFVGTGVLIDPMAVDERNCGSAIIRKKLAEERHQVRCDAKLDRRTFPGIAILGFGTVIMLRIRPSILTTPD